MVKTRTNRRQRLEVKKKMRDAEICPHCSRRVMNLDEHIKREHGYRCDMCSKIFGQRQQWVNHVKDFHQQTEEAAERDSKVSKIDAWLNGQRKKGKAGKSGRAKNRIRPAELPALASAQVAAAALVAANTGMEADSDGEAAPQVARCAQCGAEGPREAAALARQGLTYRCELAGRLCAAAPGPGAAGARAVAAPQLPQPTVPLVPGAAVPTGFGAPQPAAPPAPAATAPSGFGAPCPAAPPAPTAAAPLGFGAQGPALPFVPAAVSFGFGVSCPSPVASFTAPLGSGFGIAAAAAKELAAAASVPVDDDDDEDL